MTTETKLADLPAAWRWRATAKAAITPVAVTLNVCADELEAALARQSPSYEALSIIALSVAAALERAGFTDVDDPGDAIDIMSERAGMDDRTRKAINKVRHVAKGAAVCNAQGEQHAAGMRRACNIIERELSRCSPPPDPVGLRSAAPPAAQAVDLSIFREAVKAAFQWAQFSGEDSDRARFLDLLDLIDQQAGGEG